jgi:hypothetical protein
VSYGPNYETEDIFTELDRCAILYLIAFCDSGWLQIMYFLKFQILEVLRMDESEECVHEPGIKTNADSYGGVLVQRTICFASTSTSVQVDRGLL